MKAVVVRLIVCFALLCCLNWPTAMAQPEIPIGTWRANLSYNRIFCIAIGNGVVYGASEMGIVAYDKSEQSFSTLNKVNGLSSSGITWISYHSGGNQLLVTYDDGNLDIVADGVVTNFSRLKDLNTIVGSKRINHITTHNNFAYLSTDYGIVVFNIVLNELKETWRDLGPGGSDIKVFQTVFQNDSIYAATSSGIIAGKISDNLLDFNNWIRYDEGDLSTSVKFITSFNNNIYSGIDGVGVYRIGNTVTKEPFLSQANFASLQSSANALLIVANKKLWSISNQSVNEIADAEITVPLTAHVDEAANIWIGDSIHGLVSNVNGAFEHFLPNGPLIEHAFGMRYLDEKLYVFSGGFNLAGQAFNNAGMISYLEDGIWKTRTTTLSDVTDVMTHTNKFFTASFGDGLLQENEGSTLLFDDTNSPLISSSPSGKAVKISALEKGFNGLWVANFDAMPSLHLLKNDNTWASYTAPFASAQYPIDLAEDFFGNLWMATNPAFGGGLIVYLADGTTTQKSDVAGAGGLLNKYIRCVTVDRDGNVWVGTDGGVAYFYSESQDAVIPIFENRFLLKDDIIYDIAVDGANHKWMATKHGAWLFNETGEEMIYHFTTENSPLVSDMINDIEINHQTGEVFFATDKGIVSFRGSATAGSQEKSPIKIFPNPVTADFNGTIGITGLVIDASVKITDTSGKVVWETQARGGTATWNLRDYNGRRASTGIYLVYAASAQGKESVVGKIAVID